LPKKSQTSLKEPPSPPHSTIYNISTTSEQSELPHLSVEPVYFRFGGIRIGIPDSTGYFVLQSIHSTVFWSFDCLILPLQTGQANKSNTSLDKASAIFISPPFLEQEKFISLS
jgi:hypothetical protein